MPHIGQGWPTYAGGSVFALTGALGNAANALRISSRHFARQRLARKPKWRTRNYGFLHCNSKRLIAVLQWLFGLDPKRFIAQLKPRPRLKCPCCGADMVIVQTRLPPRSLQPPLTPALEAAETVTM